jgi:hypothetical protein
MDKDGNELGKSGIAAKSGITQVSFSRVIMAAPGFGKTKCFIQYQYYKTVFYVFQLFLHFL